MVLPKTPDVVHTETILVEETYGSQGRAIDPTFVDDEIATMFPHTRLIGQDMAGNSRDNVDQALEAMFCFYRCFQKPFHKFPLLALLVGVAPRLGAALRLSGSFQANLRILPSTCLTF